MLLEQAAKLALADAQVQEFLRTGKQFGAMKRESEGKAARIAMENLARTAGYPDPNRLSWAMEAEAVADLRDGAVLTATAVCPNSSPRRGPCR